MSDDNETDSASISARQRQEQARRLLIQPDPGWRLDYVTMTALAAVIAGLGMRLDSGPIVIGAMLVAPVMRPVLGLGFSCVTSVPVDALRRLLAVLALTSVGLVGIGWVLTVLPSTEIDLAGEVLARTAPDLRDLLVALAAGVVGAFAVLRPSAADSIPGVAIAVALVPPPVAAGIALGQGMSAQATGALLLFATNLVAIVVGTVLTVLTLRTLGVRPFEISFGRLRTALAVAGVAILAVGVPLFDSFQESVTQATDERDAAAQTARRNRLTDDVRSNITSWIADSDQPNLGLVSVDFPLDAAEEPIPVSAVLLGQADSFIPSLGNLEDQVAATLDRPVLLSLRLVGVSDQASSRLPTDSNVAAAEVAADETERTVESALREWADGIEIVDITTGDDGRIRAIVAIAGDPPPVVDLDIILARAMGTAPDYDLVIGQLFRGGATADRTKAQPSEASEDDTATLVVNGRPVDLRDVCLFDDGGYRFSADGFELELSPGLATITAPDLTASTEQVDVSDPSSDGTSFDATFDRAATGIDSIQANVGAVTPPC